MGELLGGKYGHKGGGWYDSWEREEGEWRRAKGWEGKRCPRVDPIGAPNLGIRICPLICGFHRNCLSTRRLATGTSHIHLLYATRSRVGPREDTRVFTFSRVFPSRETLPSETFIAGRESYTRPSFVFSTLGVLAHAAPLLPLLPSGNAGFLLPAIVPVAPSSTTSEPIVSTHTDMSLSRAFRFHLLPSPS